MQWVFLSLLATLVASWRPALRSRASLAEEAEAEEEEDDDYDEEDVAVVRKLKHKHWALSENLDEPGRAHVGGRLVFAAGEGGWPCIRIPVVLEAGEGVLLAFAECRAFAGDWCASPEQAQAPSARVRRAQTHVPPAIFASDGLQLKFLCQKSSRDGGNTWSGLSYPAGLDRASGQPSVVYDASAGRVLLHALQAKASTGERPQVANFQIVSEDHGQTWSSPAPLLPPPWDKVMPGPGRGLQLTAPGPYKGRLLTVGHFFAYQKDLVWYSDNAGRNWSYNAILPQMDEAQLAELPDGEVVVSARNAVFRDEEDTDRHPNGASLFLRAVARSGDGGHTFDSLRGQKQLSGPQCMTSLLSMGGRLYHSSPRGPGRQRLMIKASDDGGQTWPDELELPIYEGSSAYSCLTTVPRGPRPSLGLLWEAGPAQGQRCNGPGCRIFFSTVPLREKSAPPL